MNFTISPENTWLLGAVLMAGVAVSIYLEQTRAWAAKVSGPVVALVLAMVLANLQVMPTEAPLYDVVDGYLVPLAIPLLLFRANLFRIVRETGGMFKAFHVSALGTLVGAFLAAFLFRSSFDRVPEVTGIMTGSYIGGSVNFVAVKSTYEVGPELANPLIVADNFIMAGLFGVLLVLSGSRFLLARFPHPHTPEGGGEGAAAALAARHWRRKDIALLDIAKALGIAFVIAALAMECAGWLGARFESRLAQALFGNAFVWITLFTVGLATWLPARLEAVHGAEELGAYLLYLFFFVIGLRADLWEVVVNMPVLFVFCLVMALANLVVTLLLGRVFKLNLEELLVAVNANLGGAPSAAAMAIARGWSELVLPALLVGIWGYVIGTFLGILTAETLLRVLGAG